MSDFEHLETIQVDGNPHLFMIDGQLEVGTYWFHKDKMVFYDPVWGKTEIGGQFGDQVLLELSKNPLVRRTMSVEQLTLDQYTETIPNAANFSRWEHMWGSVALVRKMAEDLGLDDRQRLILQLRTFVSDLGHTAYSHLGDWMFQGVGGDENQHDTELMHLMEISGVNDILRANAIQPEEVVFPEVEDWVECPAPDLCVDRVDYGAREIKRWVDLNHHIHNAVSPESFMIDEHGRLVMASYDAAINFSKAFLLLPTEHWSEPVHRLQLYMQEKLVKRVLTNDETGLFASGMDAPNDYYPRDYLYSFDFDLTWEQIRSWDEFTTVARTLMEDIGRYRRRYFVYQRKGQLSWLFSEFNKKQNFPHPLSSYGEGPEGLSPLPPNVSITPINPAKESPDLNSDDESFDFILPPMKPRHIDPLFKDRDGNTHRLSAYDPKYKKLLAQQQKVLAQAYLARIHLNRQTARLLKEGVREIDRMWDEALSRPRMPKTAFRRMLGEIALASRNHKLVNVGIADIEGLDLYLG